MLEHSFALTEARLELSLGFRFLLQIRAPAKLASTVFAKQMPFQTKAGVIPYLCRTPWRVLRLGSSSLKEHSSHAGVFILLEKEGLITWSKKLTP